MLEIKNLSFSRFEQKILHEINLAFYEEEFVILVGPNGSGKSTLLKMLNGQTTPTTGRIVVDNKIINNKPIFKIAHDIATLTQDLRNSTFSELSVLMNMNLALSRSRLSKTRVYIKEYLASFNPILGERLDIQAGNLSGGQRQSLALAMCFAHTPRVLLLDEHTSALDPKAADALMALTNEHVRQKKIATIMITHSLEHALKYGDRLIALSEGHVSADISGPEKAKLSKDDLIKLAY